jgi:hypothetical protein
MKRRLGALNTFENKSKMSSGAENIKTRFDTLVSAQNESGIAKHKNGTRCPRYRVTVENESGSTKHENGIQHSSHRKKRARERKT